PPDLLCLHAAPSKPLPARDRRVRKRIPLLTDTLSRPPRNTAGGTTAGEPRRAPRHRVTHPPKKPTPGLLPPAARPRTPPLPSRSTNTTPSCSRFTPTINRPTSA